MAVPDVLVPFLESSVVLRRLHEVSDLQAVTRPLDEVGNARVRTATYFSWKLCIELRSSEMRTFRSRFHTSEAGRPWHVVKEEIETTLRLAVLKQNKKSLNYSSLVAYRLSHWRQIKEPRRLLFSTRSQHRPLAAEVVVQAGDQIVVVRLPTTLVRQLYTEVRTLKFDEATTEDERIAQLLAFDTVGGKERPRVHGEDDRLPPAHYVCHNCGLPGHWRKNCESGRRMATTGIPKAFLKPASFNPQDFNTISVYVDGAGSAVEPVYPTFVIPGGGLE